MDGWVGVDLDGTLAEYNGWEGPASIGPPIQPMVQRVKRWLAQGVDVRICTARVTDNINRSVAIPAIEAWCQEHIGQTLLFGTKDFGMIEMWDDRSIAVEVNTGRILGGFSRLEEALEKINDPYIQI